MIWVGANDGPVSVTRDNGKTWKNVTPKDLVGARIQTVEDSPHMKGRAYIAAYRYMREHDLKPYIYRTDNYGESWTLLTDGKNGIPDDFPTRVVREDPKQPGLLYAGTEFGAFVSFNAGKNWQPLQQNLPVTPVTDIKVHRNDLVIATMGRSAWIMDNITPLQELARIVNGARRRRPAAASASASLEEEQGSQLPAIALFQPREAMRIRNSGAPASRGRARISDDGRAVRFVFRDGPERRHEARSARCERRRAPDVERSQPRSGGAGRRRRRRGGFVAAAAARPASGRKPACSASRGTCAIPARGRRTRPRAASADRWCRRASTASA